uniref:Uncharacterized protein n=1 Tax=Tetranychus urticae TaxID=32264 RepID=T1KP78_TETUR
MGKSRFFDVYKQHEKSVSKGHW